MRKITGSALVFASSIIDPICRVSGADDLIHATRDALADDGILDAIGKSNTPALFDWLVSTFSYQGISDAVARGFIEQHGTVRFVDVSQALVADPCCNKLIGYWHFAACGYDKTSGSCAEPESYETCPLPTHRLRNGRLNQMAYSLFFFMRDVAGGDLVAWIDKQLEEADRTDAPDRIAKMQAALIEPLQQVYGISSKVISMTLADLLMGARGQHERWFLAGSHLIAVDTLVHNFLDRTGILRSLGAEHRYGPACYREGGCASIIRAVAASIDARQFNRSYPANFPRFIQHAIWRFCAQDGLDLCNGNQIHAGERCGQAACPAFLICATADEDLRN